MRDIFEPSDFDTYTQSGVYMGYISPQEAATLANAKFNEWLLREGKIVYKQPGFSGHSWQENIYDASNRTHKAILVCIEPIEKPKCEHENVHHLKDDVTSWVCEDCGEPLRVSFEPIVKECNHVWLTPSKNRTACKMCGADGRVEVE